MSANVHSRLPYGSSIFPPQATDWTKPTRFLSSWRASTETMRECLELSGEGTRWQAFLRKLPFWRPSLDEHALFHSWLRSELQERLPDSRETTAVTRQHVEQALARICGAAPASPALAARRKALSERVWLELEREVYLHHYVRLGAFVEVGEPDWVLCFSEHRVWARAIPR